MSICHVPLPNIIENASEASDAGPALKDFTVRVGRSSYSAGPLPYFFAGGGLSLKHAPGFSCPYSCSPQEKG